MFPALDQAGKRVVVWRAQPQPGALPRYVSIQGIDLGTLAALQLLHHRWAVKFVRAVFFDGSHRIVFSRRHALGSKKRDSLFDNPGLKLVQCGYFLNVSRPKAWASGPGRFQDC